LLADNRTSDLATYDDEVLVQLLEAAAADDDLIGTGYDGDDLDDLLAVFDEGSVVDPGPSDPPSDPITKVGDLILLGEHRLLCGDSTNADALATLMDGEKAGICFTSPPYQQQRDYGEAKELVQDWDALMRGVFANLPMRDDGQVLVNLGLVHRNGEWLPYWDGWIEWMRERGWLRAGFYVWDKLNPMPALSHGRLACSHEFVFHFCMTAKEPLLVRPNKTAGETITPYGFRPTGSTTQPSIVTRPFGFRESVARVNRSGHSGHPAAFPVDLADYYIGSWSGNAYEPFCGSGTTLIACEQLNRRCYGMEIDPGYCDVIVTRWEEATGQTAVRP